MPDQIFLRDLRIDTVIGIFEWERHRKQTVSIDLTMPGDIRRAAGSDHINDTLNYKAVAERIIALTEASSFQLVETLAERIAELCLHEFGMAWVDVRVNKPGAVEGAKDVGVMIRRGAIDGPHMHDVLVALGSNVRPAASLRRALELLEARFGALSRSTAYENAPVGITGDAFINLVVGFCTAEPPAAVRDALRDIDREVTGDGPKTTLGAHLLLYGDVVMSADGVTLPNTALYDAPFVLRPLAELAGHRRDPTSGTPFQILWRECEAKSHVMTPVDLP